MAGTERIRIEQKRIIDCEQNQNGGAPTCTSRQETAWKNGNNGERGSVHGARNLSQQEMEKLGADMRGGTGQPSAHFLDNVASKADRQERHDGGYRSIPSTTKPNDFRTGNMGQPVEAWQNEMRGLHQKTGDEGYNLGKFGKSRDGIDGKFGPQSKKVYEYWKGQGQPKAGDLNEVNRRPDAHAPIRQQAEDLRKDMQGTNVDDVTRTLAGRRNDDVRGLGRQMEKTGEPMEAQIKKMDNTKIPGDHDAYKNWATQKTKGEENEGANARATSDSVNKMADDLVKSQSSWTKWQYTDKASINKSMTEASPQQIRALDDKFRKGFKGNDGSTYQYNDGLRGFLKGELSSMWNLRGSAHVDAVLADVTKKLDRSR